MGPLCTVLQLMNVHEFLVNNAVNAQYYGRLISNGWGGSASNGLAGDVYAIDSTNFQIIGFSFDGSASPNCSGESKCSTRGVLYQNLI